MDLPEPESRLPALRNEVPWTLLPTHQLRWWLGAMGASIAALLLSFPATSPLLVVIALAGAAVSVTAARRPWLAPVAGGAVVLAALPFTGLGTLAILAASVAAGVISASTLPYRTDLLDKVNGGLATLVSTTLGLWAASVLAVVGGPMMQALTLAAVVGLLSAQGVLPALLRLGRRPVLPTRAQIVASLRQVYREPAFRGLELFRASERNLSDAALREGLAEVATWVVRLQETLQDLDQELLAIDAGSLESRIASLEATPHPDAFTRERHLATVSHLRRLLDHRRALATERDRTGALVDYALAYLEEARAGLALARHLPGEDTPERLREVLHRLRSATDAGDARRRAKRELDRVAEAR